VRRQKAKIGKKIKISLVSRFLTFFCRLKKSNVKKKKGKTGFHFPHKRKTFWKKKKKKREDTARTCATSRGCPASSQRGRRPLFRRRRRLSRRRRVVFWGLGDLGGGVPYL
jgi:hypothetical protein